MIKNFQNQVYFNKKNRVLQRDTELINLIKKYYSINQKLDVLDVGCGNGDLIEKLNKIFPNINFLGIDSDKELLEHARKRKLKNCTFKTCSLNKFNSSEKFDIVIASGLLSFFSDFRSPLRKLIKFLKNSHSRLFIFGRFNSENIDVKITVRDNTESNKWMQGFNSYSVKTISFFLRKLKKKFFFMKFKLKKKIKPTSNLTKTYTLETKKNEKIILNKANIIAEFFFLVVKK